MKKVTIVDGSPRKNQRRPIEVIEEEEEFKRFHTAITAPNKQVQADDFYEVDLSDEEDRKDKKSQMSLRRKTRKTTTNKN